MERDADIAVMKERMENLKDQLQRFISHLESEQRVSGNISKRVDQVENRCKDHNELLMKFDRILLNEGKGLSFRIDRMERLHENSKDSTRWAVGTIISVVSLVTSVTAIILMLIK